MADNGNEPNDGQVGAADAAVVVPAVPALVGAAPIAPAVAPAVAAVAATPAIMAADDINTEAVASIVKIAGGDVRFARALIGTGIQSPQAVEWAMGGRYAKAEGADLAHVMNGNTIPLVL